MHNVWLKSFGLIGWSYCQEDVFKQSWLSVVFWFGSSKVLTHNGLDCRIACKRSWWLSVASLFCFLLSYISAVQMRYHIVCWSTTIIMWGFHAGTLYENFLNGSIFKVKQCLFRNTNMVNVLWGKFLYFCSFKISSCIIFFNNY